MILFFFKELIFFASNFKNFFKIISVSSPKIGGGFLYLILDTENFIGLAISSIFFFRFFVFY